jgi:hypothetical protein
LEDDDGALDVLLDGALAFLGCSAFTTGSDPSSESDSELEDDDSALNAFFTSAVELKPDAFFTTVDSESELEPFLFLTTALSESSELDSDDAGEM